MKHHLKIIASYTLSFIVLSYLFSMDMFLVNKTYAQDSNVDNIIPLPLPQACVFDDGENPKIDPDECEEIGNNEETLGSDNIFFTLNSSPRSFDTFICTLQDQNGVVLESFDCLISPSVAEAKFESLEDGYYVFIVTASRTISDNNLLTPDAIEEAASPPFNFRVGIGGNGGGGLDLGDKDLLEQGQDVPVNVSKKDLSGIFLFYQM